MKKNFYRLITYYLSIFIIMVGGIQLLPLLVLPFYPDEISYARCFLIPGISAILIGILAGQLLKKNTEIVKLEKNYDAVLIVLIWLSAILISTVPWMLKGDYNFTQAAFEMTSGFSTTGLSVVDVENTPHVFLMFRSITLFVIVNEQNTDAAIPQHTKNGVGKIGRYRCLAHATLKVYKTHGSHCPMFAEAFSFVESRFW